MATTFDVPYYEYIVIGCGGIGSAALYWLSRATETKGNAKNKVLGLEQFRLGHENGGSQDHSRIIRLLYDDEKYTKLTPSTYEAWSEVESESGIQLIHKTGSLELSLRGGHGMEVIEASVKAMANQNIPFERLDAPEIRRRFPQFRVPDNLTALYQADGGVVSAALANAVHVQLSRSHGATVIEECAVTNIITSNQDDTALVVTTRGSFRCRRVVITSGSWSNEVLGSVGIHIPLVVSQEQVTYYATPNLKQFTKDRFPVFIYYTNSGCFYGLPIHGNTGTKLGLDAAGYPVTPSTRTFIPDPEREQRAENFLRENIPGFLGPKLLTKTCLYDMPYDRHFVVDTLASRGRPQITFCIGAGHAFKFASLLGKILAEIATTGKTTYDISGFTMDREAITNPTFEPVFKHSMKSPPAAKL
jgi:sarcosine oxidase